MIARAIALFRARDPLILTHTHRLAKEMRFMGVKVQTYHSLFKLCGARRARATGEDLALLQTQKKYNGPITIWKATRGWATSDEVLFAVDGDERV